MAVLMRVPLAARMAVVAAAMLAICARSGNAAAFQAREEAIKAAFLYNFTKFVEWPHAALPSNATFHVCVLADPAHLAEITGMLQGEEVRDRPVRLLAHPAGHSVRDCHLLYFGQAETEGAVRVIAALKQAPVLTVGEGAAFAERGGMIAFVLDENRVKFDINKAAIDRAGLSVSAKLLRVARTIHTEPTH
jgi:hypothetical protein